MTLFAKDIMLTQFDKIHIHASVEQAIHTILNGKVRETGHKTISLIVINDSNQLAGLVSMYDILYHLRPDFLNYGINGNELQWKGQLQILVQKIKAKKVYQVMSREVLGVSPDEHLMSVLDLMIKKRYRRLPVLENNKPVGIVYLSDIYYHLFSAEPK